MTDSCSARSILLKLGHAGRYHENMTYLSNRILQIDGCEDGKVVERSPRISSQEGYAIFIFYMVSMAEWIRRQFVALVYAGSNPVGHPILELWCRWLFARGSEKPEAAFRLREAPQINLLR